MEKEKAARYSIVIPLFNEEENLRPLYMKVVEIMNATGSRYQVVFVDDGSSDRTCALLREICANDSRVVAVRLRRNFGQTTALQAGFDYAEGEVIISLDGELQHDPGEHVGQRLLGGDGDQDPGHGPADD